jgi:hypothetical protein
MNATLICLVAAEVQLFLVAVLWLPRIQEPKRRERIFLRSVAVSFALIVLALALY